MEVAALKTRNSGSRLRAFKQVSRMPPAPRFPLPFWRLEEVNITNGASLAKCPARSPWAGITITSISLTPLEQAATAPAGALCN